MGFILQTLVKNIFFLAVATTRQVAELAWPAVGQVPNPGKVCGYRLVSGKDSECYGTGICRCAWSLLSKDWMRRIKS